MVSDGRPRKPRRRGGHAARRRDPRGRPHAVKNTKRAAEKLDEADEGTRCCWSSAATRPIFVPLKRASRLARPRGRDAQPGPDAPRRARLPGRELVLSFADMRFDKLTIKSQEALARGPDPRGAPRPRRDPARAPAARAARPARGQHGPRAPEARHSHRRAPGDAREAARGAAEGLAAARRRSSRAHSRACSRPPSAKPSSSRTSTSRPSTCCSRSPSDKQRPGRPQLLRDAGAGREALLKALASVRGSARVTDPGSRSEVPGAREVRPRPHRGRAPGQDRSRSSAATRRSAASCRCSRAAPRTTRC